MPLTLPIAGCSFELSCNFRQKQMKLKAGKKFVLPEYLNNFLREI
jgi:hypothetical protein